MTVQSFLAHFSVATSSWQTIALDIIFSFGNRLVNAAKFVYGKLRLALVCCRRAFSFSDFKRLQTVAAILVRKDDPRAQKQQFNYVSEEWVEKRREKKNKV